MHFDTATPSRWKSDELSGRSMSDFLAPEDRPLLRKLVEDARVRRLARRSATLGSYLLRLQAGPPPRLPGVSVRLRHSVTDAAAVAFKEHFAVRGHAAWLLFVSLTVPRIKGCGCQDLLRWRVVVLRHARVRSFEREFAVRKA